jgi:hypothetical protein
VLLQRKEKFIDAGLEVEQGYKKVQNLLNA